MDHNNQITEVIQSFPFLQKADASLHDLLSTKAKFVSLNKGQVLFNPGDPCNVLVFVLEGSIRVYLSSESGRQMNVYRIEKSQTCVLSTSAILSTTPFPAYAEVEEPTRAMLISSEHVLGWMHGSEPWRTFIFSLLNNRMSLMLLTLEEVLFERLDIRLARLLTEHCIDNKVNKSHIELANELGTSREVVSRLLKDFETKQWIERSRTSIVVLNPTALATL